ncbi:MAG TPA: AAA family ATPase [Candidatus Binataceae bacterium]|nr:AAA family ATPase [Candidatus Binataceae bacterium]
MTSSEGQVIPRAVDLPGLLGRKSYFLLGPRQTGKSFLIRHTLAGARLYDLLDSPTYLALSRNPERIAQEVTGRDRVVVIDEVQRLPGLLNEVHRLIETRRIRFLLTGSSARKLRGGGVNLLGGRARTQRLHPLTSDELGARFDLARAAERGLLPSIYFSDDPRADLEAYAGTYLQQEIVAEGATRNAPAFSRFLRVAAACNGAIVNFTNVANDAQVPRTTVYEYFEILKYTLVLHECRRGESRSSASRCAHRSTIFSTSASRLCCKDAPSGWARRSSARHSRPSCFTNSSPIATTSPASRWRTGGRPRASKLIL